ncbi:MAG TPA: gamma carbonic anhydrase family protein [Myxococcota bacterium]|nr:gamma carbonic anhydrase family protein [Myxococcota bacterium]
MSPPGLISMIQNYLHYTPKIHSSAWIHASAVVIGEVELAAEVGIWPTVVLRGDQGSIYIGEETNIQDGSVVHATGGKSHTWIGPRVTVGHRVILHGCRVEENCLIGMGSILLDNCVIEPGCIIGAGALVGGGKRIPSGSLVLGNPGKIVRQLGEADYAQIAHAHRTYLRLKEEHRLS